MLTCEKLEGLAEDNLYVAGVRLINQVVSSCFDVQLLPLAPNIFSQLIKELCSSSSSYSFHFRHLSFNGIMKEAISSQNLTDPIDFST